MNLVDKVSEIFEIIPYLNKYSGKIFVIKYGGSAMLKDELSLSFAQNISFLKKAGMYPVIVHGGGPEINRYIEKLDLSTKFVEGRRVTDSKTMEVVEMVLSGKINKKIVSQINKQNAKAIGISGKDGLAVAEKIKLKSKDKFLDLGLVGEVNFIDTKILFTLHENDYIPVISPISETKEGETLNINADSFAGELAIALKAEKLILLTDTEGIFVKKKLISYMNEKEANFYIGSGDISGGMIPKVLCCIKAMKSGVKKTHIIDGRKDHSILLEIFTDKGSGTLITL